MKGSCENCGKRRNLAKIQTTDGERYACRACRKLARREYPAGRQLENLLAGQRPAGRRRK